MSSTTSPTLPHAIGAVSFQATAALPDATEFNVAASSGFAPVGGSVCLTLTPAKGTWPSGLVLTPQVTGIQGAFAPPTQSPIGTLPAYFTFTPSAPGTGTFTATASFASVSSAPAAPTPTPSPSPTPTPSPTPAPAPTPTPAPGPTSDGTLTGLPSSIVAGQPLSAVTYAAGQAGLYFVLYRPDTGFQSGSRWGGGLMPGNLLLLIPQGAGTYTVRGYDAQANGNLVYESAQFAVTAAPGPLPTYPTQTADTNATSSSVTMNWAMQANASGVDPTIPVANYRVLARVGVGAVYGSLADATVTTSSYTFTGLAPRSSPRAVIIARNANGYGPPTGQLLSFTAA